MQSLKAFAQTTPEKKKKKKRTFTYINFSDADTTLKFDQGHEKPV